MANLLLLDDNEVAARAMRGIAARSRHRCVVATKGDEAWRLLRELVVFDLAIVEVRLQSEDGMAWLARLRADPTLKALPVVVYTSASDHALARKLAPFKLQNFLLKPYSDEAVHAEIARACSNPWRNVHFEEPRSFCAQLGLTTQALNGLREDLIRALRDSAPSISQAAVRRDRAATTDLLTALQETAQAAGVWGVYDHLQALQAEAEAGRWMLLAEVQSEVDYLARLIHSQLKPDHVPAGMISDRERQEEAEAKDRVFWLGADVSQISPLVPLEQIHQRLDTLAACPVIDTTGAEFAMAADAKSPNLQHLMDLVVRDPTLSAQVLLSANALEREDPSPIEDPQVAVALLGNLRLSALARQMPPIEERHMHVPPITWAQFWMFQMGVASVAQFTARFLEFEGLVGCAHTAGMIHDLGKLLLLRLYPFGFQAIVGYARRESVPLRFAEYKYLGCSSRDLALRFAQARQMPPRLLQVLQWVETPESATEDRDLVAVVSLARTLCLHNHVGYCGDTPKDECPPVEKTPAWEVLRTRVYPSFNLRRFDAQAQDYCRHLKQEILGRTS